MNIMTMQENPVQQWNLTSESIVNAYQTYEIMEKGFQGGMLARNILSGNHLKSAMYAVAIAEPIPILDTIVAAVASKFQKNELATLAEKILISDKSALDYMSQFEPEVQLEMADKLKGAIASGVLGLTDMAVSKAIDFIDLNDKSLKAKAQAGMEMEDDARSAMNAMRLG